MSSTQLKGMLTSSYSFITGLEKTFFRMVVIAGPLVLGLLPQEWMNLTLGAALTFLINFSKNYTPNA